MKYKRPTKFYSGNMNVDNSTTADEAEKNNAFTGNFKASYHESMTFPLLKSKNTVIKYTKIPNFDLKFDTAVSWPKPNSYVLAPYLRRIVTIEETTPLSTRSLKPTLHKQSIPATSVSEPKRKIVSILDDQDDKTVSSAKTNFIKKNAMEAISPRSYRQKTRTPTTVNKPLVRPKNLKSDKEKSIPIISDRTGDKATRNSISKFSENTNRIKINRSSTNSYNSSAVVSLNDKKKESLPTTAQESQKHAKFVNRKTTKRELPCTKYTNSRSTVKSSSRAQNTEIVDNEQAPLPNRNSYNKNHILDNIKLASQPKSPPKIQSKVQSYIVKKKSKDIKRHDYGKTTAIYVPLENETKPKSRDKDIHDLKTVIDGGDASDLKQIDVNKSVYLVECGTSYESSLTFKDENVNTEIVMQADEVTDTADLVKISKNAEKKTAIEDLHIPNVSLVKDKYRNNDSCFSSRSWPDLKVPTFKIPPIKKSTELSNRSLMQHTSQIIGTATVTYMTKHEINFQVLDEKNAITHPSRLSYPFSVVSLFKKDFYKEDPNQSFCSAISNTSKKTHKNAINKLKWKANDSCMFNKDKLVKPSDIISSIRLNNVLLEDDYISEQFQRELNFIDSFLESLHYLESCSLSNNCLLPNASKKNHYSFLEYKNSGYSSFLANLENGTNACNSNTMASKSLCLLNYLIRDEQKRAKNLLFVLKMRENALRDFTKSQILYLENKKKSDNIDISTLKKKQRGALLKLQHECGEMSRMRKALLTLSEKRKDELLRTKKNIELKLSSRKVDYNSLLSSKKRIRKPSSMDRQLAPLKCFELSTSCEDYSSSLKVNVDGSSDSLLKCNKNVICAEKSIQTNFSISEPTTSNDSREIVAENFVVVDGKYLNILFHNLSMPEIFSSGKSYEVNQEALNNIITSGRENSISTNISGFLNQIKNHEDKSSSPSTARSLVDELEQCYKKMFVEGNSSEDNVSEASVQVDIVEEYEVNRDVSSHITKDSDSYEKDCDRIMNEESQVNSHVYEDVNESQSQSGPLPIPAGESAENISEEHISTQNSSESSVKESQVLQSTSLPCIDVKADTEAELLLKQQIAIEREIKALEQQQSQLMAVREIPDKPPPPYTPPNDVKVAVTPCKFSPDDVDEEKVRDIIAGNAPLDNNAFNVFLDDYFSETLERHESQQSTKPWDVCNMHPKTVEHDKETLIKTATEELKDVLSGAPKGVTVSGLCSGRTDHIEDILFEEWRRCETEWTSLHVDEIGVKNQVFDSIIDKLLTETLNEYKKVVHNVDAD